MPGWHEASKHWTEKYGVQTMGIIQEQHPERNRLFMQWKQMDWPVLVDSYNLLELTAVPITLLLDEYGVIRVARPKVDEAPALEESFLQATFDPPLVDPSSRVPDGKVQAPDLAQLQRAVQTGNGDGAAWRTYGIALAMWGGVGRLDDAIEALEEAAALDPAYARGHFQLGVVYRKRYDSEARQPGDFQQAVAGWSRALALDPNQYIWRRRIEQYGPRLDKPYSFYDWVPAARKELAARGEEPVPLSVEPGGAEYAYPVKEFAPSATDRTEPDPAGRIHRDDENFVDVEVTVVPPVLKPGASVRVSLALRPNPARKAHWNNEVDETVVWISGPDGDRSTDKRNDGSNGHAWQISQSYLTAGLADEATSTETRTVEFELKAPQDVTGDRITLPAYALYYVCEGEHGTCLYRRQDLEIVAPLQTA